MSFAAFTEANIFKPLGMTVTHFHDDQSRLVNGRAYGYARTGSGEVRLDTPGGERVGAGGVFTSVRDLHHWGENFYTGRVGGRALIARVQSPGALNGGKALTYAWGLELGAYRGLRIVEHGGSLGGYRAHLLRFPEQHVTVACLCNMSSIVPAGLARQVADVALANRFTQPTPAGPAPAASGGGRGRAEAAVVQPAAADDLRFRGMTIHFERDAKHGVIALAVDAGRVRGIRFVLQKR